MIESVTNPPAAVAASTSWTVLKLTNDQSVTSSTTPVDITGLTFSMVAGETYEILFISTTSAGAGGTQIQVLHPTDAIGIVYTITGSGFNASGSTAVRTWANAIGTGTLVNSSNPSIRARIAGTICSATGGTFTMQFAQSVSNGTASTLQENNTALAYRKLY